jgi:hypothetical protein
MRGRSDIFVGFIETGLRLLNPGGALGFIVADRWMHNQYGAALREFIADGYAMETVLSMHDVDAFEEQVSAYPAITVIRRGEQGPAVFANATADFDEKRAVAFTKWAGGRSKKSTNEALTAVKLPTWFDSSASWPSGNPANLALVADLERRFPSLEDWVRTDIKGWTLADLIDGAQYELLLAEARKDLAAFMRPDGTVAFASPAHIASAVKR